MNPTLSPTTLHTSPSLLVIVGSIAMLLGAIEPMEGSLLILFGSGMVALGSYLGQDDHRTFRVWAFILIAFGVAALWGLSRTGGIGGDSGHSMWWGVLILPYPIGWSMNIWGPGSPRWVLVLGIALGLWNLAILAIVVGTSNQHAAMGVEPIIALATFDVLTIGGCVFRLVKPTAEQQ